MPLRLSDDIRAAGTHRSGSSLPDPRASLRAEQRVRDERRGRLSDARCKFHHTIQVPSQGCFRCLGSRVFVA
jgi:hypothetical protein